MLFKRFIYNNYFVLSCVVAGFFLILFYAHFWGIGVTQDSIVYTSAAKEFNASGSITFMQKPLVDFPVFYPLFLWAVQSILHVNLVQAAPVLNAVLFASVIFLCGLIINGLSQISGLLKSVLLLFVVLSPSLLEVYTMLWSETLFIVLLLLFIVCLKQYLEFYSLTALLIVSTIAALACVTRYAGITLIATGGFLILFAKPLPPSKKIIHLFAFVLISSSLLAVNLFRNAKIRGTLTGTRQKGVTSLSENIYYYGKVICDWLPFLKGHYLFASVVATIFLLSFCVAFIYFQLKKSSTGTYGNIAITFFTVYSLFIITTSTLSHFEQINNRLLSPMFISFLLGSFTLLHSIIKNSFFHLNKPVLLSTFFLAFLFISIYGYADYQYYLHARVVGFQGYNNKIWNTSTIAGFLKNNSKIFRKTHTIYSNENGIVYYFSGLACDALPQKINKGEIIDFYDEDYIYVIWFNNINNRELLNLNDVLTHKKMTCLYTFTDGKIFVCEEDEGIE